MKPKLLLVRASPSSGDELEKALAKRSDILVETADSIDAAHERLKVGGFEAVVCEDMPRPDLERLASVTCGVLKAPLILLTRAAVLDGGLQDIVAVRRFGGANDAADTIAAIVRHASLTARTATEKAFQMDMFREALDSSADFTVIIGEDHRVEFANKALVTFLGIDPGKVPGMKAESLLPARVVSEFGPALDRVLETGNPVRMDSILDTPQGKIGLDLELTPLDAVDGRAKRVLARTRDVTHERLQKEGLRRLNRVYSMAMGVQAAIIKAETQQELFDEVCRVAFERGQFNHVWIGLVDGEGKSIVSAAEAGPVMEGIRIPLGTDPARRSPSAVAVTENRTYLSNDVSADPHMDGWRAEIEKTRTGSMATFPLRDDETVIGVLHIASGEKGYFDKDETELLESISDQISFAVRSIRRGDAKAKAEEALASTRRMLEAAFRASPVPIIVLDREARVQMWNGAAERVFGWAVDEVSGSFNPLIPEDGRDDFRELFKRLMKGEAFTALETKRMKKDGTMIDVSLSTAPMRDSRGNIIGVVGAVEDVTERMRAERALRESQEQFKRLTENAPDIIFRLKLKPEPRFVFANPACNSILGYSPEEFYADPTLLIRITGEEHRGNLQAILDSPELTREPLTLRITKKDGSEVWCEARLVGVHGADGKVEAIEGVVRDVTATMRAVEALERRSRAAELSTIKIFAYLDFVNHDIANILTPILSYTQLLADRVREDETAQRMVGNIMEETTRAATFITNVRRISSIERLADTKPEPLDLREAVRMAVDMSVRMVPDKQADVKYDVPGDREVTVPGKGYLEDVLQAVATNSLIHSKRDRAELEISIRSAPMNEKDRFWLLTMADHGPGIPDDQKRVLMTEVFDPSEATRRGIVPSIKFMALIVEALGGEMWLADRVEGDPGSGLKVMIMLPEASEDASRAHEVKLGERIRTS